jgi:hypothetical protein
MRQRALTFVMGLETAGAAAGRISIAEAGRQVRAKADIERVKPSNADRMARMKSLSH